MNDIKTHYHYDALENKDVIAVTQDCEPIVDEVKLLKQRTDGRGDTSLGYHVGRIPAAIINQYLKFAGVTFEEFCADNTHVMRIINNPELKRFRIFEGKV